MTDYDKTPGLNWSSLKYMASSPLAYRWVIDHPPPRKPAYTIGAAIHCAVLEPSKFGERYAVFDGTRRGKEWDSWLIAHPGHESLKPPEMATVLESAVAVRAHRVAAPLLHHGRAECAITWQDPSGIACKGRLDYLQPTQLVDLKSARQIDPRNFARASGSYLYHAQVAWYHDGAIAAHQLPPDAEHPYIVAVEKTGPYDVGVYQLTAEDLELGRAIYRDLVTKLVACTEANYWPGAVPDLAPLNAPKWSADMVDVGAEDF